MKDPVWGALKPPREKPYEPPKPRPKREGAPRRARRKVNTPQPRKPK